MGTSAEAVEPLERESPRPAAHAVSVGDDVGAEVAPAEVFAVKERHVLVGLLFFFGCFFLVLLLDRILLAFPVCFLYMLCWRVAGTSSWALRFEAIAVYCWRKGEVE